MQPEPCDGPPSPYESPTCARQTVILLVTCDRDLRESPRPRWRARVPRARRSACGPRRARLHGRPAGRCCGDRTVDGGCVGTGAGRTPATPLPRSASRSTSRRRVRRSAKACSSVPSPGMICCEKLIVSLPDAHLGILNSVSSSVTLNSTFSNFICATCLPLTTCAIVNGTMRPSTLR